MSVLVRKVVALRPAQTLRGHLWKTAGRRRYSGQARK
jgi:hypothetical protein